MGLGGGLPYIYICLYVHKQLFNLANQRQIRQEVTHPEDRQQEEIQDPEDVL